MDSLLSIVQMPAGVPVATVSIGGARNAGLLAVRILGASDPSLRAKMAGFQASLEKMVAEKDAALREKLLG
jgi:5-(carboxyamino)imidazole ribonucleotide mutase